MAKKINTPILIFNGLVRENHPLAILKNKINWSNIKNECTYKESSRGRKGFGLEFHLGAAILKHTFNFSDDRLAQAIIETPVHQYFCGFSSFQQNLKINPTTFVKFRKKFGADNFDILFKESITINGEEAVEENVIQDTTVANKDITYPTDSKLALHIYDNLLKIKRDTDIKLKDMYRNDIDDIKRTIRFENNKTNSEKVKKAKKTLNTIVKRMVRDVERNLEKSGYLEEYKDELDLYTRVLNQTKNSKNKIYSLEEVDIYCVAKGKAGVPYEYGFKVGIAIGEENTVILGNHCCKKNIHDSKVAPEVLDHVELMTGTRPKNSFQDRGFAGALDHKGTNMICLDIPSKDISDALKEEKRFHFRRRSAVEAIISHLKLYFRLGRDFLKGFEGSNINLKLACIGYNVSKFLRKIR